jgi:hypothetical protein
VFRVRRLLFGHTSPITDAHRNPRIRLIVSRYHCADSSLLPRSAIIPTLYPSIQIRHPTPLTGFFSLPSDKFGSRSPSHVCIRAWRATNRSRSTEKIQKPMMDRKSSLIYDAETIRKLTPQPQSDVPLSAQTIHEADCRACLSRPTIVRHRSMTSFHGFLLRFLHGVTSGEDSETDIRRTKLRVHRSLSHSAGS